MAECLSGHGREFQTVGADTRKLRSPNFVRDRGIKRSLRVAESRLVRPGASATGAPTKEGPSGGTEGKKGKRSAESGDVRRKVGVDGARRAARQPIELKFLYLNARSVMNKLDELAVVVEACNPDVVGITESWATGEIMDSELSMEGYVLFREDRRDCEAVRGGGVILYVKESLNPGVFRPVTDFPEQVWCSIKMNRREELLIGVCYRSGSDIFSGDNNKLARDLIEEVHGW